MNAKALVLGLAVAASALAGSARPAAAQATTVTTRPVVEFSTRGGFVLYNINLKVYASGLVVCTETFPRQPGETLIFHDILNLRDYRAFTAAVPANFNRLPARLYFRAPIADLPDRIVTVRGRKVEWLGRYQAGAPLPDQAFQDFVTKCGELFERAANREYCRFSRSGGFAFQQDDLVIKNDGSAHVTSQGALANVDKDYRVPVADMNELKRRFSRTNVWGYIWYQYPRTFATPGGADQRHYSITWNGPYGPRTVGSEDGANEGATYRLVKEQIEKVLQDAQQP